MAVALRRASEREQAARRALPGAERLTPEELLNPFPQIPLVMADSPGTTAAAPTQVA